MYNSSGSDGATIAPLSNQDWLMLEELFHDANREAIEQIEALSLTSTKPPDTATKISPNPRVGKRQQA